MSESKHVTYNFKDCVLYDAIPGHTFLDFGDLKGFPDAKALLISGTKNYYKPRSKVKHEDMDEDTELCPSICILLYSPEQAMAYADIFAEVAEDLKKLKENKED